MNNLSVLENGIVPVYTTDTGERVVDGRELWRKLESKTEFSHWIKRRFDECDALQNQDFSVSVKIGENLDGGRPTQEYTVKLAIAKEMAMLERNDIGKQVRKYFIAVEEKHTSQTIDVSCLSPELQMFKQMWDSMAAAQLEQKEMKKQLAEAADKAEAASEKADAAVAEVSSIKDIIIERDDDWRSWINKMFNNAVMNSPDKDFRTIRSETYEMLDRRAGCDTGRRLENLKHRLRENGAAKSKMSSVTRLDVIETDIKLKEIYTAIVKELAVRYAALPSATGSYRYDSALAYYSKLSQ